MTSKMSLYKLSVDVLLSGVGSVMPAGGAMATVLPAIKRRPATLPDRKLVSVQARP